MRPAQDDLEALWDALLSREADLIRQAFNALRAEEKKAILAHLKRMTSEPGWHPEQVASARAALEALKQ